MIPLRNIVRITQNPEVHPDLVTVFTYQVIARKVTTDGKETVPLEGAGFTLYKKVLVEATQEDGQENPSKGLQGGLYAPSQEGPQTGLDVPSQEGEEIGAPQLEEELVDMQEEKAILLEEEPGTMSEEEPWELLLEEETASVLEDGDEKLLLEEEQSSSPEENGNLSQDPTQTPVSYETRWVQVGPEHKDGSVFTFPGAEAGQYKLVETTVPDGYQKAEDRIFTINAYYDMDSDKPLLRLLVVSPPEAGFQVEGDSVSATILNIPGAALPSTGGPGTRKIYLTGFCLLGIAGMLLRKHVRR